MCGRFTICLPTADVALAFGVAETARPISPSFNVAPGMSVPVVVDDGAGRRLDAFRWGLVPSWAKDLSVGYKMINARAETLAEKPAFRRAFRDRRCLILADGFYEWKTEGRAKRPYYIRLKDSSIFAFAGIWEIWTPREGEAVRSCAIVTTEANDFMKRLHHRMPVILPQEAQGPWLDPANHDIQALQALLVPLSSGALAAHPVSTEVNSPRNDSPRNVLPWGSGE
jgi:putative SOS response-associated peptidase YedK